MTKDNEQEARATYTATNKDGYSLLITIPFSATKEDIDALFNNLEYTDSLLAVNDFKPGEAKKTGASTFTKKDKDWTGEKCPKDGGRLYKGVTKTGKTFVSCENRKFNFMTKETEGCEYIVWPKEY